MTNNGLDPRGLPKERPFVFLEAAMGRAERQTAPRNLQAQTRALDNPYEVYVAGDWEWRVLKHYQRPEKEKSNRFARVFCAVRSPLTYGSWEYGDVYLHEIQQNAILIKSYEDEN